MQPSKEAVLEALDRILASEQFKRPARLSSFLRHIVNETLQGRAQGLNSFSIALDVFDPHGKTGNRNSGTVRRNAIRLREALDRYYRTEGHGDGVRISLPKGGYIPKFTTHNPVSEDPPSGNGLPGNDSLRPLLIVERVVDAGNSALYDLFVNRLTARLASIGLARVVGPSGFSGGEWRGRFRDALELGEHSVVLSSWVAEVGNEVLATWWLLDAQTEVIICTDDARAPAGAGAGAALLLADYVSCQVLGAEGAIVRLLGRSWESDPVDDDTYFYRSQCIPFAVDEKHADGLQAYLESAVRAFPNLASAWALLSQTCYFRSENDAARGEAGAAFAARAAYAATMAAKIAPNQLLTRVAQMYVAWSRDFGEFERIANELMAQYPGAAVLKVRVGARLIHAGRFDEGEALVEQGIRDKRGATAWDIAALATADIGRGAYDKALASARRAESLEDEPSFIVIAVKLVALAGTGQLEAAAHERDRLLALRPTYGRYFMDAAQRRRLCAPIVAHMVEMMEKAGLAIDRPAPPAT